MILIPILALILGGVLALVNRDFAESIPREYIGVAVLAGVDTVFGGIRSSLEGRFQNDLFLTGFLFNTILAVGLVALGFRLGIAEFYIAAVVTFGGRLFLNASIIRRQYLTRLMDIRGQRRKESDRQP